MPEGIPVFQDVSFYNTKGCVLWYMLPEDDDKLVEESRGGAGGCSPTEMHSPLEKLVRGMTKRLKKLKERRFAFIPFFLKEVRPRS